MPLLLVRVLLVSVLLVSVLLVRVLLVRVAVRTLHAVRRDEEEAEVHLVRR